ncbi:WD40/YVTN repeat-like-containing domain [Lasallia pustulata]|uniref:WD40/YVTN repeat-like-containing domain n=1 Tax=Lasallia pustulata TaxID=136370 RepID=A0A1W5CTX4_9LECA|nr:WD40/YVTN repeat-like-containing domain [Lasallia pustulata]
MWQSALERRKLREQVQAHVPCSSHTRQYRGHCNVKTVKDVNFFGMQDEYVVSGSDSGHLFIWDKKTTQLVNILEGDGEVVNVVQGHP